MKNRRKRRFFLLLLVILLLKTVPCAVAADTQKMEFLAGNKALRDTDAFVFVVLGDGFTESEQTVFFSQAKQTAEYILGTSPYREQKELFKFYGVFEPSAESGARGEQASSLQEALADRRDTFYHSSYWTDGIQRLLAMPEEDEKKAKLLARQFVPDVDYSILLVNATTYGGSGGEVCVASLHEESLEIVLHELGHTIAGLGDEYWPGADQITETPNTTRQSKPALVPWAKLVGTDGVGVYPFPESNNSWYRPSQDCKMQYLGREHDFCAVCKAALTEAFAAHSNAQAVKSLQTRQRLLQINLTLAVLTVVCIVCSAVLKKRKKKIGKKD